MPVYCLDKIVYAWVFRGQNLAQDRCFDVRKILLRRTQPAKTSFFCSAPCVWPHPIHHPISVVFLLMNDSVVALYLDIIVMETRTSVLAQKFSNLYASISVFLPVLPTKFN